MYLFCKKSYRRGKPIKTTGLSKELVCFEPVNNILITGFIEKCSNLENPLTFCGTSIFEELSVADIVIITGYEKSNHKYAIEHVVSDM